MKSQPLRLALRVEGDFWNAYLAPMDAMQGAVFLGSLHMRLATQPPLKRAFMDLMRDATTVLLEQIGAPVDHWNDPVEAPESERGGRA